MDSIEYYCKNAGEYFEDTVDIDLQEHWERFMKLLPEGGSVLDLGCGSGRDSAHFISCGFDVTAMDASEEMCDLASIHIGQDVLHLSFAEMDFEEVFDGVWANASLLHVPEDEIEEIIFKVVTSLKIGGVLYMSFQYGDFEGIRGGRYYKDYRQRSLKELIVKFENLELIDIGKSMDVRPDKEITWIYALVRRTDLQI